MLGVAGPASVSVVAGVEQATAQGDGLLLEAVRSAFPSSVGVVLVAGAFWLIDSRSAP